MGMIINLGDTIYSWDRQNSRSKYTNRFNGLKLTDTGWKNFNITKHRRDTSRWGGRQNTCNVCGSKCCQAFGNNWEQICIKCSTEWLENSIKELDKMKAKMIEQQKYLNENGDDIMKKEKVTLDKWEKQDILDKLEDEQ